LEELRKLHKNFWDAVADRVFPWRALKKKKLQEAQDMIDYRKKLLMTKKDRAHKGIVLGAETNEAAMVLRDSNDTKEKKKTKEAKKKGERAAPTG